MKIRNRFGVILICALITASFTQLTSCKKNDPDPSPSAQDNVKAKLVAGIWKIQSVTVDDVDKTSTYPGLTILFTPTTYTTTNGKAVWPPSGTWTFTSQDGTTIKRDDGKEVKVEVADASLKLSLDVPSTTLGTGRLEGLQGKHVFTFTK